MRLRHIFAGVLVLGIKLFSQIEFSLSFQILPFHNQRIGESSPKQSFRIFGVETDSSSNENGKNILMTTIGRHNIFLPSRRSVISNSVVLSSSLFLPEILTADAKDLTNYPSYDPVKDDKRKFPVLIILHGAGENKEGVWNLANIQGEHAGLAPSLLASGMAPQELYENFIVVTPYSKGKRSFYEEPRSKLLQFIQWILSEGESELLGIPKEKIDSSRLFLFGFSDGATVGVELMTTRKFRAGIFAAYGFTGELPKLALERLDGIPMWFWHSADDVIFPVECSDRIVTRLLDSNKSNEALDIVRYNRFDQDQEGFSGRVKGHSTGITATKSVGIYQWLLSFN